MVLYYEKLTVENAEEILDELYDLKNNKETKGIMIAICFTLFFLLSVIFTFYNTIIR